MANIMRTSWLAAAILNTGHARAQTAAVNVLRHIMSIAPDKRTSFESYLAKNVEVTKQLEDFAHRTVPVCVWQINCTYKALFQFLALRFLLAPDKVLDCERAHASWNWICPAKRNTRMPAMNA